VRDAASAAAASVPGVEEIRRLRLRRSGSLFFADVTLAVESALRVENAHRVADRAEAAVKAVLPADADVVIHIEPGDCREDDLPAIVRACAARHSLETHAVRVLQEPAGRSIEMHVEVANDLQLEEAHRRATQLENDLRDAVPDLTSIATHIEPAVDARSPLESQSAADAPDDEAVLEKALSLFAENEPAPFQTHDLKFAKHGEELDVSFHCTLDAATPITAAHDFTQRLESFIRGKMANLGRVLIHAEPAEPAAGDDTK